MKKAEIERIKNGYLVRLYDDEDTTVNCFTCLEHALNCISELVGDDIDWCYGAKVRIDKGEE